MGNLDAQWEPRNQWVRRSDTFAVEISRHTLEPRDGEGTNRWAVYAYVRKDHPHFREFKGDGIFQTASAEMPFHRGCTLVQWTFDSEGKAVCVKAGADYNHLHDDFTHADVMPGEVLSDANRLYEWMLQKEG